MIVSVVHEDGTENEFELDICCPDCSYKAYGWDLDRFTKLMKTIQTSSHITLPNNIDSLQKFIQFIKTI